MSEHERDQTKSAAQAVDRETQEGENTERASTEQELAAADERQNGRPAASATADTEEEPTEKVESAEEGEEVVAEEVTVEDPQAIIAQLEAELMEATAKAEQYLDQMQRTAAEFQNARKRQERQLERSIDRATEGIVRRLLPILDDFELALSNVPDSLQGEEAAWSQGFERIHRKLIALLEEEGVTPIERAGEFDPNRHEAVTHEPSDEVESGHIIETLRTGYEYKDRVLRPALVRVAQ